MFAVANSQYLAIWHNATGASEDSDYKWRQLVQVVTEWQSD